ncbi:MAG: FGGY-family carbohydrate kinase [Chloroflexota bacterium]|nr:FGGY-family carbohydrate kinase [Chloroflexota bacterium]
MQFVGLDIGTTGCKSVVFDQDGTILAAASREYPVEFPHPNWAEQDPESVWGLAQESLREAFSASANYDITALGLSVQGEAVMPVDAAGQAMRPAILGMDTRTDPQNDWLRERFGAACLFERTGMPIHTVNTLPKLLWLKENEPELWAKADRFLLYEDFLMGKMTGQAVISRCLASRTQLFDIPQDRWSEEILSALDLSPERLATVKPSGIAVGPMRDKLAQALGLPAAPLVVTGGHDQACGALGVGLIRSGLAMDSTGTAEVVEVAMGSPVLNDTLLRGNISVYAHTAPDLYLAMTLNHSGGILLRWFRDTLGQEEIREAQASGGDAYDLLLQAVSPEPTELLVLPHFAGSGTPTFDTASKGAILGLTFKTDKQDLAKAILEGLTYELRLNLDLLKEGGVAIDELRAIGGGARSDLWLQLKADITGIPVVVPRITEAACWGAALLAGAAVGCFASAASASEDLLVLDRRFEPDPQMVERYDRLYALYGEVYPAVASISHRL